MEKGEKKGINLAVAAIFVCKLRIQWSHWEASSVCEALLSLCIPSPSFTRYFLCSKFPETWILSDPCAIKQSSSVPSLLKSLFISLAVSFPALLPKASSSCKGHDPCCPPVNLFAGLLFYRLQLQRCEKPP